MNTTTTTERKVANVSVSMAQICHALIVEVMAFLNIKLERHLLPEFPRLLGYGAVECLLQGERINASRRQVQMPPQLTQDVLDPVSVDFIKQNSKDFPIYDALIQVLSETGITGSIWTLACRLYDKRDFVIYPPRCQPTEYNAVAKEYALIRRFDSSTTDDCVALAAKVALFLQDEEEEDDSKETS